MTECHICTGELIEMGVLGRMRHFRCRACGAEASMEIPTTAGTFAIDIACSHCGAKRDARCLDMGKRNGQLIGSYHLARVNEAKAKTKAKNEKARKMAIKARKTAAMKGVE